METILIVLSAVIGYLLGSANSSLIVGKFYGVDVRKHGSGNAGTTNVLRTLGKSAALLVLAGDVLKGIVSCIAGFYIAGETGLMAGGIFAVLGHNWPLFFGFKGGKGALISLIVIFVMDWRIGFIVLAVFLVTVILSRYVSLGSILGACTIPVASIVMNKGVEFIIFASFLGLLVIARHYSNIIRIVKGTESKLGKKAG